MTIATRKTSSRGFTLLEVILALSLSAVLMAIIVTVLYVQARAVDSSRSGLDDARLAHSILKKIGDDLSGAIRYEPVDTEALKSMSLSNLAAAQLSATKNTAAAAAAASSGQGGASTGGTSSGSGTGAGSSGSSSSGSSSSGSSASGGSGATTPTGGTSGSSNSSSSSSDTSASDSSTTAIPQPGLVGDETSLKIDVSRLPRLDEYAGIGSGDGGLAMPPCDVRTICYQLQTSQGEQSGGLMKSELHRAAALYADANGGTNTISQNAQVIAPEVRSINFSYFDGGTWWPAWPPTTDDTQTSPGLPLAVKVTLEIPAGAGSGKANEQDIRTYSMVVKLESGGAVTQVTPASDSSSSSSSGSQPSSGAGGSSSDSSAASSSSNGTGSQNTPGNGRGGSGSSNGRPGGGSGLPGSGVPGGGLPGTGSSGAPGPGSQTFKPAGSGGTTNIGGGTTNIGGGAGADSQQPPIRGGVSGS